MKRNIEHASMVVGRVKALRQDVIDLQSEIALHLDFVGASRDYCNEKVDALINQCNELKIQLKAIEKLQKERSEGAHCS